MPLENKPIDSVEEADLLSLVENKVAEGKSIEYKRAVPGNSDSDKREFLADLSSFANAGGGHLIFGIKEKTGVPIELSGVNTADPDTEILRLENILRDGMEPRIPGISMKAVSLANNQIALVIRVPRSWASPHRVAFRDHGHFYSRNSAGKYRLDVAELRAAIALSETASERIRSFRADRLTMIVAGDTPIPMGNGAKIVLHIVPLGTSSSSSVFDLASLAGQREMLQPLYSGSWSSRHNFDGFLTFRVGRGPGTTDSYVQVFRNGSIEAIESGLLRDNPDEPFIPSMLFERELLEGLRRFLAIQAHMVVEPPLIVMLSLVGVAGYRMGVSPERYFRSDTYPIDRDSLIIPEILVDGFDANAAQVMRPAFDAIWNAAGWPGSLNYDQEGKWVSRR